MIRIYGTNNGFDWKMGDTIGAQIVSVPMSVPLNIADRAFRTRMIYLCGLALAALILLDVAMVLIVIRPVSRLSALADEVLLSPRWHPFCRVQYQPQSPMVSVADCR
jgi:hypothetical protein